MRTAISCDPPMPIVSEPIPTTTTDTYATANYYQYHISDIVGYRIGTNHDYRNYYPNSNSYSNSYSYQRLQCFSKKSGACSLTRSGPHSSQPITYPTSMRHRKGPPGFLGMPPSAVGRRRR